MQDLTEEMPDIGDIDDALFNTKWRRKPPIKWTTEDVIDWMYFMAAMLTTDQNSSCWIEPGNSPEDGMWNLQKMRGENWHGVDGFGLCSMQMSDFIERDPHHGKQLFELLHQQSVFQPYQAGCDENDAEDDYFCDLNNNHAVTNCSDPLPTFRDAFQHPDLDLSSNEIPELWTILDEINPTSLETDPFTTSQSQSDSPRQCSPLKSATQDTRQTSAKNRRRATSKVQAKASKIRRSLSSAGDSSTASYSSDSGAENEESPVSVKKKRRTKINAIHLWQFMLALLADSRYNPEFIKWLDRSQGVFRIVKSAETAKLWGVKKKNPNMTFEKMSRALRWCRDNGFLAEVPKNRGFPKKLCFCFGEFAENWNGLSNKPISEIVGVSGL